MPGVPDWVLVHVAVPQEFSEPQSSPVEWVEGEPGPQGGGELVAGVPFVCVLFLPTAGGMQANPYRVRVVESPTLLYNATRSSTRPAAAGAPAVAADGSAIVLADEDEVRLYAPDLAAWLEGENPSRWQVSGASRPAGPPGTPVVVQTTLSRVVD